VTFWTFCDVCVFWRLATRSSCAFRDNTHVAEGYFVLFLWASVCVCGVKYENMKIILIFKMNINFHLHVVQELRSLASPPDSSTAVYWTTHGNIGSVYHTLYTPHARVRGFKRRISDDERRTRTHATRFVLLVKVFARIDITFWACISR